MASPFSATLILCDAAIVDANGKTNMLGAGWSVTTSPTAPHAVAVLIKVPWDRTNQPYKVTLQLKDSDGAPLEITGPDGKPARIGLEAQMEAGRPPGIPHGSPIDAAVALSLGPLPLQPGRYVWSLEIDSEPVTSEGFTVIGRPSSGSATGR